jgi:hypothetical protein
VGNKSKTRRREREANFITLTTSPSFLQPLKIVTPHDGGKVWVLEGRFLWRI